MREGNVAVFQGMFNNSLAVQEHTAALATVFEVETVIDEDCCSAAGDTAVGKLKVVPGSAATSDEERRLSDADRTSRRIGSNNLQDPSPSGMRDQSQTSRTSAHIQPGVQTIRRIEAQAVRFGPFPCAYRSSLIEQTIPNWKYRLPAGRPPDRRLAPLPNEVLIVDDHKVARITVRSLLEWHDFDVCGEALNGTEAIEKVRKLRPGIVLLDLQMPGMNGIQTAYEIRQIAPSAKIVFFTIHGSQQFADATRAFGHAFVPKSAAGTELIPTLRWLIASNQRAASA